MLLPPELWAVLLFAGQMADMWTTRVALQAGIAEEANPVGRWILSRLGFAGMQVVKALMAGAVFCVLGFLLDLEPVWVALTGISWFAPVWNAWVIRKGLRR